MPSAYLSPELRLGLPYKDSKIFWFIALKRMLWQNPTLFGRVLAECRIRIAQSLLLRLGGEESRFEETLGNMLLQQRGRSPSLGPIYYSSFQFLFHYPYITPIYHIPKAIFYLPKTDYRTNSENVAWGSC